MGNIYHFADWAGKQFEKEAIFISFSKRFLAQELTSDVGDFVGISGGNPFE
jgi:hypothetical protein